MQPFLFLGTRAEDDAADSEYAAVLAYSGLSAARLHRIRLEAAPLGEVELNDWAGIILGGGPFNVSDADSDKTPTQIRVEADLAQLAHRVINADSWFLGCCYGIGTLGVRRGGIVDRTYAEPVGAVTVQLTPEGTADPLFGVLPDRFDAFVGHKEAVRQLPTGAVLLAGSATCPVQGFRLGDRVYATQFHPELDPAGLATRVDAYQHHGYFEPTEADRLKALAHQASVTEPAKLLARFVELAQSD